MSTSTVESAAAGFDLAQLSPDHYQVPAEIHAMGPNAEIAADYLGVGLGEGHPEGVELAPCTAVTEVQAEDVTAALREGGLGKYIVACAETSTTSHVSAFEAGKQSPATAVKPAVKGVVLPQYTSRAAHAAVAATRESRNLAYALTHPKNSQQ